MMKLFKIINGEADYIEALSRSLLLINAAPGSIEFQERELLIALIKDYEYRLIHEAASWR